MTQAEERTMAALRAVASAAKNAMHFGGDHTNFKGCGDAWPMYGDVDDIPADVDCEGCQAAIQLDAALAALDREEKRTR